MILATRFFILAALLLAAPALAQSPGACARGTAQAELDMAGVRARLFNKGNLFFDGGDPNYEVPKGSGITSIFTSTIWVGGLVEGELRLAAASYAQFGQDYEFYPGPLDAAGNPPEDCAPYDRIWKVSRVDIDRYERTGTATADLAEWPAHLGAPFFDADRDGSYDLAAGDRPKVWGDQTAWWVMNDAAGPHLTTLSEPLGLEARVTAFAKASAEPALHYATFYRYELTYRGEAPLDSAYFTFFVDADLGNYEDDYIGSAPELDLGFVYNADNDDEVIIGGYGIAPPAQGVRFLETPDDLGLTVFNFFWGSPDVQTGNPGVAGDYYNYMRGLWKNGQPITVGGYGAGVSGEPTTIVYPNSGTWEDPVPGFWSEVCPDTPVCGHYIPPSDRRFQAGTGPFQMRPGETKVVTFALIWARGQDNFDSLRELKVAAEYVKRAYDLGHLDPVAPELSTEGPAPPRAFGLAVYPRPFRDAATVQVRVPEHAGRVRVAVFDVLGREVAVLADGALTPGEHTFTLGGAALPAGLYLVRIEAQRQAATVRVARVR